MQVKRLRFLGLSAIGLCLVMHAVFVSANPGAASERCGLGVPPGTRGFAEDRARQAEEVRRDGFLRVCEANLKRYDMSFSPSAAAVKSLAFQPVDLSKTPFAKLKSLGATAEAVNRTKSRLYRGFRMPDGRKLTLFEHDMSADGTRMWRDPKDETERVGKLPAHLSVFQAGSGNAISALSWMRGRRYYELWIDANVALTPLRQQLFALAASLPASVPACPNEAAPEPFHFGPDGMPVLPSAPDVLTVEQVKESLEKETRRCR
ncbi:hypothetical protein GCM10027321_22770 [Massilia terrae]|uniref:Lipoprotein transmembrane n=1 Tax=Massilia terrae TaxID=1811224 RepID=A0ABT2CX89_9BURK|nr:hypothetical protein [Massilia terrae]MCS0658584.1 hypothetical protein [Massilia terrae]